VDIDVRIGSYARMEFIVVGINKTCNFIYTSLFGKKYLFILFKKNKITMKMYICEIQIGI
jgi:hypothetical protein